MPPARPSFLAAVAASACAAALLAMPISTASGAPSAVAPAATTAPRPPAQQLHARSSLPPGESGFFPIADQAFYEVNKDPSAFGPHVDDQREPYWNYRTEPDGFATPSGTPATPRTGVRIYRDGQGVPLIYGKTGYDVWYGDGYAAATDRLFEMDAIRRTSEGTLAALVGASDVPADLEEQTVTYTQPELTRMFHRLSPAGRQAIAGYAAGVEARIKEVQSNPSLLPGEYALLTSEPADWSVNDTMATGVFLTRNIASQGGLELVNVATLRGLEKAHGRKAGRAIFDALFAEDDPSGVTTIHDANFHNLPKGWRSSAKRHLAYERSADFADRVPLSLATGPGTGDSPVPGSKAHASQTPSAAMQQIDNEIRSSVASIEQWTGSLHGGSFAYAVSGSRTKDGHAMLVSNPQLVYSYPSELYEIEVHGAGYDARGVGVPGIPTVGIGHTSKVAWALTTGYSKTIDSFIERTRKNPRAGGPRQYLHDGKWHNESCRTTHVMYRLTAPEGIPVGPADRSETAQICRTDPGPVVATTPNGRWARSVDYAMWMQEDQTVNGILDWDRAKSLKEVAAGVRKVRWNENITAADAQGNIGYWHPGRYFRRPPGTDQRFPLSGTGGQDERGYLPFRKMPHVVNPAAGFLANWNNKPARGWVDGDLSGTNTRTDGPDSRVGDVLRLLSHSHRLTAGSLIHLDRLIGEFDHRWQGYRLTFGNLSKAKHLTTVQRKARSLLQHYDGLAYAPGAQGGSSRLGTPAAKVTDGPAATLFVEYAAQLKRLLFGSVGKAIRVRLDTHDPEAHLYDVTPLDNDALRVLVPHFSALHPLPRWLHGRTPQSVERAALVDAVKVMVRRYGHSPASWRRPHGVSHVDSLSGVVGPSTEMPFEDRGTWMQEVAFTTGQRRR